MHANEKAPFLWVVNLSNGKGALDPKFKIRSLLDICFMGLPSTWFPVHPTTYGPPNHSGGILVNQIFSTNHVVIQGFVCAHWRCSPSKGGSSFQEPCSSRNACFGFTYRLSPTWKWSDTIIHTGGNIRVVFLSFLPRWESTLLKWHTTFCGW